MCKFKINMFVLFKKELIGLYEKLYNEVLCNKLCFTCESVHIYIYVYI